ncbi:MAG TPA: hypothetical protein PKJ94_14835 [Ferruginibacter sp.]|nr:hypothetical protein [Ferruginibacter sp.]
MNVFPYSGYDIGESDINAIIEIHDKLKLTYFAEFDRDFTFNYKELELFKANSINDLGPVICIKNSFRSFHLAFIEISYRVGAGSRYSPGTHTEYQTWGITSLKNAYGHILIKPETFLDKIHELINSVELDFEDDREFSKKFYVVTDDPLKARLQLNQTFRDHIMNIQAKEFFIEIIGNKLIIGNKKVIEPSSAIVFTEFMNKISRYF